MLTREERERLKTRLARLTMEAKPLEDEIIEIRRILATDDLERQKLKANTFGINYSTEAKLGAALGLTSGTVDQMECSGGAPCRFATGKVNDEYCQNHKAYLEFQKVDL